MISWTWGGTEGVAVVGEGFAIVIGWTWGGTEGVAVAEEGLGGGGATGIDGVGGAGRGVVPLAAPTGVFGLVVASGTTSTVCVLGTMGAAGLAASITATGGGFRMSCSSALSVMSTITGCVTEAVSAWLWCSVEVEAKGSWCCSCWYTEAKSLALRLRGRGEWTARALWRHPNCWSCLQGPWSRRVRPVSWWWVMGPSRCLWAARGLEIRDP